MDETRWLNGFTRMDACAMLRALQASEKGRLRKLDEYWRDLLSVISLEQDWQVQIQDAESRSVCLGACQDEMATPEMIRDIFGNPYRPLVRVNPQGVHLGRCTPDLTSEGPWRSWHEAWVTQDVFGCARSLIAENKGSLDPVGLCVLADALEDAQCSLTDVLAHLRSPGKHYPGCWAVQLVLGR